MSPSLSRRDFLKQSGMIAAAAGTAGTSAPFLQTVMAQSAPRGGGRQRVLLFHDPAFPFIDCDPVSLDLLQSALQGNELRVADADSFPTALQQKDIDLLITAHGSAFPEDAGMPLLGCLARGVNWLQLGGVPLAVPVRRAGDVWQTAPRRTRWHRKLCITQAFPVDCTDVEKWAAAEGYSDIAEAADSMECDSAFALYWRLTSTKYFPQEDGSAGTRDAILRPLINGQLSDGTAIISPVQLIDWMHGDFAGGRWVIFTGSKSLTEQTLTQLAAYAGCGAISLTVSPGYARYRPGETPSLNVQLQRPHTAGEAPCVIEILENGAVIRSMNAALNWSEALSVAQAELQLDGIEQSGDSKQTEQRPSFFELRAHCTIPCAGGVSTIEARSGFWLAADAALEQDDPIGRSGTMLTRGGKPYCVTGSTYMAGDVQRNFLFEPNPWLWRQDFQSMHAAGINMVRTGLWYGWKRIMLEPGRHDEAVFRSMDAFLLAAQEADIPIIFSLFAFLPEAWGGENPYLDPRAVAAQQAFVGAFARRYAGVHALIWDLINEPSFSSPSQLWRCRPNYDRFELAAWHDWLRGQFPAADDTARLRILGDRWMSDIAEDASLPPLADFDDGNLFSDRLPLKVQDYRLFAQTAFAGWVRKISSAIRSVDRPDRMIMVGQDEGGTMDRPSPQFFADVVDVSSVHSWWFNDDLLWDSIVTRAPGIPHLVQETGAMFYEKIDGTPWRSEAEVARLVERKLAIAAGTGSAGFVQWLWNSNPYMPSDNEAAIGALRGDGSAKPEFMAMRDMARFLEKASPALTGRKEEDIVVVLPHADQFSVRGNGVRATRAAVRTLAYRCRVPLRAVSEYALTADSSNARLFILPSPAVLTETAWQHLLEKVRHGATLIVTGILDRDDNWQPVSRSALLDLQAELRPIAQTEELRVAGNTFACGFRGEDLQRIETADVTGKSGSMLHEAAHGKGRLLWCPLPVEMCDTPEAIAAVYREALRVADLSAGIHLRPNTPGILAYASHYRDATLLTIVSELAEEVKIALSLDEPRSTIEGNLPAGRAMLVLLDKRGSEVMRSVNS
ncbi:MAG: cellulase family glycosylhydrolase [Bacteroidota bacterium]